ncbi:MAG: NAD(P)H-dependent oxidoreductase subunit E [bacterium]|nr:NAD(P)H-dependent oxidoreductase subunit E [bacterium]
MELSPKLIKEINELADACPNKKGALLPVLYLVQKEYGFLSESILKDIAFILNIPEVFVFGVTTFYTMFHTSEQAKNIISVCTNITCSLLGSEHIIKTLENILKIKPGEMTKDKKFSLNLVECLGSCGTAPVMMVNGDLHENLTEEKIKRILDTYK